MWARDKGIGIILTNATAGVRPNSVTFVGVWNACASVVEARFVHQQIIQSGLESDVAVGSRLVDMYAKWWRMEDAWRVFNKMPS
jgi:pentatricopeptide repeat protein